MQQACRITKITKRWNDNTYHRMDWKLDLHLLYQLRHREIPVTDGPIYRWCPAVADELTRGRGYWNNDNWRDTVSVTTLQFRNLTHQYWILIIKLKLFRHSLSPYLEIKVRGRRITFMPVEVLKMETVQPVHTRSFLPSCEKTGGDETKLWPPGIMVPDVVPTLGFRWLQR